MVAPFPQVMQTTSESLRLAADCRSRKNNYVDSGLRSAALNKLRARRVECESTRRPWLLLRLRTEDQHRCAARDECSSGNKKGIVPAFERGPRVFQVLGEHAARFQAASTLR